MKKILLLLFVLIIIKGCGDFEFAYKTNKNDFLLNNKTLMSVNGDDSENIYMNLINILGDSESPDYRLVANSSKEMVAAVITKDATASKFNIKYTIIYTLYSLSLDCRIYNNKIVTENNYNAKSAGYSFGTDLSEIEASNNNVVKNINTFISSLNKMSEIENCR